MKVDIETAQLAQRLHLTAKQLAKPKIVALLKEHLTQVKRELQRLESVPSEMPQGRPGAVNHSYGIFDYRQSQKDKA
jgi:hypothetical protein